MHYYTKDDLVLIKDYKVKQKINDANARFTEKIFNSDLLNLLKRLNFNCFYCQEKLDKETWQLDHFNPRALGGKNVIENLAPSCKWCNQMKNALDGYSFLLRCKKIIISNIDTEIPSKIKKGEFFTLGKHPLNMTMFFGKKLSKQNPELSNIYTHNQLNEIITKIK